MMWANKCLREKRLTLLFSWTLVAALQVCECEVVRWLWQSWGVLPKSFWSLRGFSKEILNHPAGINHISEKDGDSWLGSELNLHARGGWTTGLGMLLWGCVRLAQGSGKGENLCTPCTDFIALCYSPASKLSFLPFSGVCVKENGKLLSFSYPPALFVLL